MLAKETQALACAHWLVHVCLPPNAESSRAAAKCIVLQREVTIAAAAAALLRSDDKFDPGVPGFN